MMISVCKGMGLLKVYQQTGVMVAGLVANFNLGVLTRMMTPRTLCLTLHYVPTLWNTANAWSILAELIGNIGFTLHLLV